MDRGAWQATGHGVSRVGRDLATKPPSPPQIEIFSFWIKTSNTYLMKDIFFNNTVSEVGFPLSGK